MSDNNWPSDATIENYLNEKTDLPNQPWSQKRIKGLKEIDNPIFDSTAEEIYQKYNDSKKNATIAILSSKCSAFDLNDVKEEPNQYNLLKQTIFRSELVNNNLKTKPINPRVEASSLGAQFINIPNAFKDLDLDPYLRSDPSALSYRWKYLLVDVDDLTLPGNPFEPIACSLFVLKDKKVMSERWNFFPPKSANFFDCPIHSQHAAIDISELTDNAYLIATYYRIFQVDSGDLCNNYYKKPTDNLLQKIQPQVNLSLQRLKNCYTPFAFSFIPLKDIIANEGGNIDFTNTYVPEKPLTGEFIPEMIEKLKKLTTLPISLKLKSKVQKVDNLKNIDSNYIQIRSIQPDVSQPILEFRHQLIVTLQTAKFDLASKFNARNILAEVSIVDKGKPLKIIHDKWTGSQLSDKGYSRCIYHEKAPIYDDEFIIDLPIDLSDEATIQINYYHVATQEKEQAFRSFASASLKLFDKEHFLEDKSHTIAIIYPKDQDPKKQLTQSNFQQIKTQLYSTFDSSDIFMSIMFGKNKKIPPIVKLEEPQISNYLFQILDTLIYEGLYKNQQKASVNGIISLAERSKPANAEKLMRLLNLYVTTFALRFPETDIEKPAEFIHHTILKHWKNYITDTKDASKRYCDITVSSFLFTLILKSIIMTNDRNFEKPFTEFFQAVKERSYPLNQAKLDQAKLFNRSLARFAACLTDI